MGGKHSLAGALAVGGMIAGIVIVGLHGKAWPHDAPTGWQYPFSCCSGFDCREISDADVIEGAHGYEIRKTHELINMSDPKIKRSPDGRFHWCSVAGADDGKTICLFVPDRGF